MLDLLRGHILPAAYAVLPERMESPEATHLLLAIAMQESGLAHRRQIGGPARGLWQFERVGVLGVVMHHSSAKPAAMACDRLLYPVPDVDAIYRAIEHNDVLACVFARLLLWTDPHPLPADPDSGWDLYLRAWRPGKPRIEHWPASWQNAA